MTTIQELTITQMQIMQDIYSYMPQFLMGLPRGDDDQHTKNKLDITNSEVNQLVSLGFLEDITLRYTDTLEELEKNSKRKHRIFQITNVGRKFFEAAASQLIN